MVNVPVMRHTLSATITLLIGTNHVCSSGGVQTSNESGIRVFVDSGHVDDVPRLMGISDNRGTVSHLQKETFKCGLLV